MGQELSGNFGQDRPYGRGIRNGWKKKTCEPWEIQNWTVESGVLHSVRTLLQMNVMEP